MTHSLTAIARRLAFIRETDGPNRGAWVSKLQRECGGVDGDSWCSDFASFVCDVAYHGAPPIRKSGASATRLGDARNKGLIVATPAVDDLYFFIDANGHAHHEGIVTEVYAKTDAGVVLSRLTGIAGNTSEDGLSSNGTGVFEHALSVAPNRIVFVRLPR